MFKKNIILLIILGLSGFVLTGCITMKSNNNQVATDGGVFKTINRGLSWGQKALVPAIGGAKNISTVNVTALVMDPSDNKAIYLGTRSRGLYYTYDGANTWHKAASLTNPYIRAIAIDPKDKCIVYATVGNKVLKTVDCSRTWEQAYFDNETRVTIDAIAIDPYNSDNIFIGLSRGDIVKSADQGNTWQTIERLKKKITKIIISPNDNRDMYVLLLNKGIYRSQDGGNSWEAYNDMLKERKMNLAVKDVVLIKGKLDLIYIATKYGLLKSFDKGETWEQIDLITPEKKSTVNALVVSPKNEKEIYYVTNTAFFSSQDGGANWKTQKLPSSRPGRFLLMNPENPWVIYMGVLRLKNN